MKTSEFIVAAARYYTGRLEKANNSGFYDAAFEKELVSVGWYKGAPWCMFFAKLIWRKAYRNDSRLFDVVNRMLNGSVLMSLNNMKNNGTFTITANPIPGSIAIWQMGNGTSGHAGIVIPLEADLKNTFRTIEGNTNASGSREGDRVAIKLRTLERPFTLSGLNLKGFINPIEL